MSSFSIQKLLVGEPFKNNTFLHPHYNCHRASSWIWGNAKFTFLNAISSKDAFIFSSLLKRDKKRGNNHSCVLSITIGKIKILLTGDIERKAEKQLIQLGLLPHQIVIAPHHGSLTSSSNDFVQAVQAKVIIFSTGFANQWKFPKTKVVKRYKQNGATEWITHKKGAITLIVTKNKWKIKAERETIQHFWNHQFKQHLK
jgi:competence protein ComEC